MNSKVAFSASRIGALALGLMLVLGFHATASAQWKWKDQTGRVQYSDLPPPPGVAEKDILQTPNGGHRRAPTYTPVAPASAAAPLLPPSAPKGDPELEAKRDKLKQEEATKRKAEEDKLAAARTDNCTRARAQLSGMSSGGRVARTNAKGEREFLDDQAMAAENRRVQGIISAECK